MSDSLPMSQDHATRAIYNFIVENLTAGDVESLAFEIGVDPAELDGELVEELAESLLRILARENDLPLLGTALRSLYPVQYAETFGEELHESAGLAEGEEPEIEGYHHDASDTDLVRVPAGTFDYGEEPAELIDLPTFHIGRGPITNAEYKHFLDANPNYPVPFADRPTAAPFNWDPATRLYPPGKGDHPVVLVSWEDALAFCRWAGLRLPSEREWEKAARGVDGRRYPWGDGAPTEELANFGGHVGDTTPVTDYSPDGDSPYGAADMAGNVWEWTASWFDLAVEDDITAARVVRGGAWDSEALELETTFRLARKPGTRAVNIGFRACSSR